MAHGSKQRHLISYQLPVACVYYLLCIVLVSCKQCLNLRFYSIHICHIKSNCCSVVLNMGVIGSYAIKYEANGS